MAILNRRKFIISGGLLTSSGLVAGACLPAAAQTAAPVSSQLAGLRGSISAATHGLMPGTAKDQSKLFAAILDEASKDDKAVFLPEGTYFVSNITLPERVRLLGVPGASRLVFTGNGHFLMAERAKHLEFQGISIDGANRAIAEYAAAALRINQCDHLVIDNCDILGSMGTGIHGEGAAGRITHTSVQGAAGECGIYLVESAGMEVSNNVVRDCANGGILIHRWKQAEDGTIVTGNRVSRIGAKNGGTGQWGNGINIFRAGSVIVNNNHVTDCAFSAIRSNSGDNVQINNNTCLRSGETAIYSEFEFLGAVISGNIVEGGTRGISMANFMQGGRMGVCSNNIIRHIHTNAPYKDDDHPFGDGINVEAETTVTGNVIEDAKNWGISLGWGPYLRNVIVTANVVRNSGTGIGMSVVDGIGDVLIANNVFDKVKNGGIVGYHWKEAVTNDLVAEGADEFKTVTLGQNKVS